MSKSQSVSELTDDVLSALYDPGSFMRGIAYADDERVQLFDGRPGIQKGLVQGNGNRPYVVRTSWFTTPRGFVVEDQCSCPLGGACKHCVAVLVTARRNAAPALADWRRRLDRLPMVSAGDEAAPAPLALEFVLHTPTRTRWAPNPTPRVAVRPLRIGKTDRWIKTGASWRDLQSPYPLRRGLNERHLNALRAMLAPASISHYSADAGPIALERFGPELWFHLQRAAEAGISLIGEPTGGSARSPVRIGDHPAETRIDLTTDDSGAVRLAISLMVDDEPLARTAARTGLIGEPAHGAFRFDDDGLYLVPLATPLHADLGELVTGAPLTVPPQDVDELLDTYEPVLARYGSVTSSDDSVEIADRAFVGPVLSINRTALDTAHLHWGIRYRRGRSISTYPLAVASHNRMAPSRDSEAERAALAALRFGDGWTTRLRDAAGELSDTTLNGAEVVEFFADVVPLLDVPGHCTVEVTGDQPELREASGDPLISLSVDDPDRSNDAGTDWFDLSVEVSIDGEEIDFATLFAALSRDEKVLICPTGTWLRLDRPEFIRLRELIDEARTLSDAPSATAVRINRFQSDWWDELTSLGVVASQSERWATSVARMRELAAPVAGGAPEGLTADLRPYQQEGVDWLVFLWQNRLGGILADDMGLGKTVQTLALCLHMLAERPDARVLVVAPTSVVENWAREAGRFAPTMQTRTIGATASRRGCDLETAIGDASLVITSYALFRLEFEEYDNLDWDLLLLDEAQFVKNRRAKTYRCVRRIGAAVKIALTGTPLENSLMDLWSLLSIVAPGLYPDPERFSETYRKPIESGRSPELLATLRRRIAPLMRRRTKQAVLTDLPPKVEQIVEIELNPRHNRIYATQLQRQRAKVLGLVDDLDAHRFEILRSLTVLRQLSLDPALVDEAHEQVGSAKLDRLVADVTEVVAEGHRALVFSQFTRFLGRARSRLDDAGIDQVYLDGRTRNRAKVIDAFRNGDAPVFLISLKAGGVGLNLTEADYCFILDPWWNPAVETQAVDRTHRIGQRNTVMVYRYVAVDTIEQKVMALKARKAALFDQVIDAEGALSGPLSSDDIRGLFDANG